MITLIHKKEADVIVLGGGLGGCMASLSIAKMNLRVIMTEETGWLGGQLTSQAVPPDEHAWIEAFGCTATYRDFRNRVRQYYKANYPLNDKAKHNEYLNPGNGWVSRLAHEPKVALKVLEDMLAPYVNSGKIKIFYNYKPDSAKTNKDIVTSVTVSHVNREDKLMLTGTYFIDATECGDVLPLAHVEYVTGAESKQETGEPHASEKNDPYDMQSITHVLAVDYLDNGNFTIEKPEQYDFWRQFTPHFSSQPLLSWHVPDPADASKLKEFSLLSDDGNIPSLFTYRRVLDKRHLKEKIYDGDISLINWPQNDYFLGPIIDVSDVEKEKHLKEAKQLSLSLLYWLQTEALRPDGNKGYPGLRLRKDVLGTEDGLAKYPYIRESRRIKSLYTITEMDVNKELRGKKGIRHYEDSVGIGSYHLDLHHTVRSKRAFYIPNYPYEIPLGALLPVRVQNLLPASKNIGTTQVANGCYRVHPTEWNIGESVGFLVSYAILNNTKVHEIREKKNHLTSYQDLLKQHGVEIRWPEEIEL